ncbi:hypothetical protein CF640_37720, partial [Burkholderia pseudomallei]
SRCRFILASIVLTQLIVPPVALQRTIEVRVVCHNVILHLVRRIMGGEMQQMMATAIITGRRGRK